MILSTRLEEGYSLTFPIEIDQIDDRGVVFEDGGREEVSREIEEVGYREDIVCGDTGVEEGVEVCEEVVGVKGVGREFMSCGLVFPRGEGTCNITYLSLALMP